MGMQRQAEVGLVRKELQEARHECKRKVLEAEEAWTKRHTQLERDLEAARREAELEHASTVKVRDIGEKALAELREANVQELGSLALRHAEAMEARRSALELAQDEVQTLREEAGRRVTEADESWQRRIAEADARGAAGIDLATRAQ